MIVYRNFKGDEFNTEQEYTNDLNKLLKTPISKFDSDDLNSYINEYFPERFRNTQTLVPFKSVKDDKIYSMKSPDVIMVSVTSVEPDCDCVVLNISASNRCDDKFKDYDNLCSGINLSTNYSLRGDILLKDFKAEVMKILKKVCKNWLNYEINEMTKMLIEFISRKTVNHK